MQNLNERLSDQQIQILTVVSLSQPSSGLRWQLDHRVPVDLNGLNVELLNVFCYLQIEVPVGVRELGFVVLDLALPDANSAGKGLPEGGQFFLCFGIILLALDCIVQCASLESFQLEDLFGELANFGLEVGIGNVGQSQPFPKILVLFLELNDSILFFGENSGEIQVPVA